jgi:hypothetical protein
VRSTPSGAKKNPVCPTGCPPVRTSAPFCTASSMQIPHGRHASLVRQWTHRGIGCQFRCRA